MAMGAGHITVEIKLKWWFCVYLNTLSALCSLIGAEPNMDRVNFWLKRGFTLRVVT